VLRILREVTDGGQIEAVHAFISCWLATPR
jgi:hypothetical protein